METTNIILSVVTAATAIVAIIISAIQLLESNKQALFERRLKVYLNIKWMKSLCDENQSIILSYIEDIKTGPIHTIDFLFINMTNVSYLEGIQDVIYHVMEAKYQKKYLIKIEELRSLCEEIRLIFPEKISYQIADFVYYYQEMLVHMYKYQIITEKLRDVCFKASVSFPKDDSQEEKYRNLLLKYISGTFELAEKIDHTILNKLKSKIKI